MSGETKRAARRPTDERSRRVAAALRQIRREHWKAALVHGVVEAAVLALVVNLTLGTFAPTVARDERLAAVALTAMLTLVAGVALRMRRPLVERFEALNPGVDEALRTARDVRRRGETSPMTARLYDDVLGRLRETSSAKLVDSRRLAVSLVLLLVLSLSTAYVSVEGFDLGEFDIDARIGGASGGAGGSGGPVPDAGGEGEGLQDGSLVLGDPEDVEAGSEPLPVSVDVGGGGGDADARSYNTGGFAGDTAVEAQRAGFAPPEVLEDAELIREYNLKIREDEDE